MSGELRARAHLDLIEGLFSAPVYRRILASDDQQAKEILEALESDMERDRR